MLLSCSTRHEFNGIYNAKLQIPYHSLSLSLGYSLCSEIFDRQLLRPTQIQMHIRDDSFTVPGTRQCAVALIIILAGQSAESRIGPGIYPFQVSLFSVCCVCTLTRHNLRIFKRRQPSYIYKSSM